MELLLVTDQIQYRPRHLVHLVLAFHDKCKLIVWIVGYPIDLPPVDAAVLADTDGDHLDDLLSGVVSGGDGPLGVDV